MHGQTHTKEIFTVLRVIFIPQFITEKSALISHGKKEVSKTTLGAKIVVLVGAGRALNEVVL